MIELRCWIFKLRCSIFLFSGPCSVTYERVILNSVNCPVRFLAETLKTLADGARILPAVARNEAIATRDNHMAFSS